MALFIWILRIATIYPPGALGVALDSFTSTHYVNTSVFNPLPPKNWNPLLTTSTYNPGLCVELLIAYDLEPSEAPYQKEFAIAKDACHGEDVYPCFAPKVALVNTARTVLAAGQITSFPPSTGLNSTYRLNFRAPQMQCNTSEAIDDTFQLVSNSSDGRPAIFGLVYNSSQTLGRSREMTATKRDILSFSTRYPYKVTSSITAVARTYETRCQPFSMKYDLNISYVNGLQDIKFSTSDPIRYEDLTANSTEESYKYYGAHDSLPWSVDSRDISIYPQDLQIWIEDFQWYKRFSRSLEDNRTCIESQFTPDAPTAVNCTWVWEEYSGVGLTTSSSKWSDALNYEYHVLTLAIAAGEESLKTSVFDINRFNTTMEDDFTYDPTLTVDITEAKLNAILSNITISAISLGTWWDSVPIDTTGFRNTYRFSQPLNLVLPYSICLGCAVIFAMVAIYSLWKNGMSATDGSFVQIMLATRGNTRMEQLAMAEHSVDLANVSKELWASKVRFGELITQDATAVTGVRRGFGTVDETLPYKKRR
ncbi:hypothetical protein ST47_g4146 [Ascochyta rabiei]|uniref:Uncharacterized protein n=1 Tax=Didymella rabiei TaxID=5454 RepID=A0A163G3Z1_DIDRA|nr:hypothetical protein ST47_g4146 [Ascochyta rabiei]